MARTSNPQPKATPVKRERYRPTKCRRCRRPHGEVHVSYRGLCSDCAIEAVAQQNRAMAAKSGPQYERWIEGMARAADEARSA